MAKKVLTYCYGVDHDPKQDQKGGYKTIIYLIYWLRKNMTEPFTYLSLSLFLSFSLSLSFFLSLSVFLSLSLSL